MKEVKIYISGGIGFGKLPDDKQAKLAEMRFALAENRLRKMGFTPINPFKLGFTKYMSYDEVIAVCCNVVKEHAQGIYMLADWKKSSGARRELHAALEKEIPVYYESNTPNEVMNLFAKHYYKLQPNEEQKS
jgi:hypothetical protein